MAQGDINVTVVGNLVADPELRFTQSGIAVATFRVASSSRKYDSTTNQWVEDNTVFMTCSAWRDLAENIAHSLQKGMRVIVTGKLTQRSYETREGEKRTVMELLAEEAGPSLRYAGKQGGQTQSGAQQNTGGFTGGGQAHDPWAEQAPQDGDQPPF